MSLDDFKALLWSYGGNLGSGSGRVDQRLAHSLELFLITASAFLSTDARLSTCIFNLVIAMAPDVSAARFAAAIDGTACDVRRVGLLASIIRAELERRNECGDISEWMSVETRLRHEAGANIGTVPLLPHLPSLPRRADPLFLSWGFAYPGVVREPSKYLRKGFIPRPADAG